MVSVSGGACSRVIRERCRECRGYYSRDSEAADGRAKRVYRMNDGPRCAGRHASTYISGFRVPYASWLARCSPVCSARRRSTRRVGSVPFPFDRFFRPGNPFGETSSGNVVVVWRFRRCIDRKSRARGRHNITVRKHVKTVSRKRKYFFSFFFFFYISILFCLSFVSSSATCSSDSYCEFSGFIHVLKHHSPTTSTRHKNRSRGLNSRQCVYIYICIYIHAYMYTYV